MGAAALASAVSDSKCRISDGTLWLDTKKAGSVFPVVAHVGPQQLAASLGLGRGMWVWCPGSPVWLACSVSTGWLFQGGSCPTHSSGQEVSFIFTRNSTTRNGKSVSPPSH